MNHESCHQQSVQPERKRKRGRRKEEEGGGRGEGREEEGRGGKRRGKRQLWGLVVVGRQNQGEMNTDYECCLKLL